VVVLTLCTSTKTARQSQSEVPKPGPAHAAGKPHGVKSGLRVDAVAIFVPLSARTVLAIAYQPHTASEGVGPRWIQRPAGRCRIRSRSTEQNVSHSMADDCALEREPIDLVARAGADAQCHGAWAEVNAPAVGPVVHPLNRCSARWAFNGSGQCS
jgi:hypothetical protein